MEQVSLYEKIIGDVWYTVDAEEPAFSLSCAVTTAWKNSGTELDKQLRANYVRVLSDCFEEKLLEAYHDTKYCVLS